MAYSYLDQLINSYTNNFKYSKNIFRGAYNARTAVNFCIKIVHYMGFKKNVLLGVDCDYTGTTHYFDVLQNIHSTNRKTKKTNGYSALTTQRGMNHAFTHVKNIVEADGVEVVNAIRGGKLESFDRVELEEAIDSK